MLFHCLALFILTFGVIESYADALYKDVPFALLNTGNFSETIFNKNNYWAVEFYSSWCGYCIRFAPFWKEFALDVQGWENVVKIGAVDCSDSVNTELCRKCQVTSYPTIMMYRLQANDFNQGNRVSVFYNADSIRKEVIKSLISDCKDDLIPTWPYLCPVRAASLSQLWRHVSNDTVLLIVDLSSSYIAEEVILDLFTSPHPPLFKVEANGDLAKDLRTLIDLIPLPVLLKVNRDWEVTVLARRENLEENVRAKFVKTIDSTKIITSPSTSLPPTTVTGMPINISDAVYMQDLENSLSYFLRQEVGVHDTLRGEKLNALKAYVKAVYEYLPGKAEVVRFLGKLSDWLEKQGDQVQVQGMINQIKEMEDKDAYLPARREWIGCKSSSPALRGYPCSLWMLFHTLTVQAYVKHQQGTAVGEPWKVLYAIKGYVTHFFSCWECSRHFQQMALDLDKELVNKEDAVLWLWRAHNKVNKRLAPDSSVSDPRHPKIQFPSTAACPQCRQKETEPENISWNNGNVLRFLLEFYGKDRIVPPAYADFDSRSRQPAYADFDNRSGQPAYVDLLGSRSGQPAYADFDNGSAHWERGSLVTIISQILLCFVWPILFR